MIVNLRIFLAAALVVTLGTSLSSNAQQSDTEISFRVLCFEQRDEITSVLAPAADGAKIEVPLYTSDFSQIIKARFTGGKATFYIEEKGADGSPKLKLVADGALAKGLRQAFVLIPTDAKTGPVYRVVAFEDGEDSFPMGSTRVINLAPFPIRLNLAGQDMPPIKPGGVGTYPQVKKVDDWNMFTAKFQFGVTADRWVDVSTQSWKSSDRKRDWVITRFNKETKQPAIRLYQDIPPWRRTELVKPEGGKPATAQP